MSDFLPVALKEGQGGVEVLLLATAEDGQRPIDRSLLSARDRAIEERQLPRSDVSVEGLGHMGFDRRVVDEHCPPPARLCHATHEFGYIFRSRDAQEDDVTRLRERFWGVAPEGAALDKAVRLRRRAIPNMEAVASAQQVAGHPRAHHAEAGEPKLNHRPGIFRRREKVPFRPFFLGRGPGLPYNREIWGSAAGAEDEDL